MRSPQFPISLFRKWPRLPFTARIERYKWSLQARSLSLQGWGLIDLPLRASNEGSPRPRVARAQKIIRFHPSPLFDSPQTICYAPRRFRACRDWSAFTSMDIKDYLEQKRDDVDRFLDSVIPSATTAPTTLHESMRYSLMAGGKRVRPILAIAAAEAMGQPAPGLMPIACSLELIHTYSLIHDDLPAMDNDDRSEEHTSELQSLTNLVCRLLL